MVWRALYQGVHPCLVLPCVDALALTSKQIQNVTTACADMKTNLSSLQVSISQCDDTLKQQNRKIADLESQRVAVDEKLAQHVWQHPMCIAHPSHVRAR